MWRRKVANLAWYSLSARRTVCIPDLSFPCYPDAFESSSEFMRFHFMSANHNFMSFYLLRDFWGRWWRYIDRVFTGWLLQWSAPCLSKFLCSWGSEIVWCFEPPFSSIWMFNRWGDEQQCGFFQFAILLHPGSKKMRWSVALLQRWTNALPKLKI